MPDLKFVCPECEASLEVDAASSGLEIECPSCQRRIVVPRPSVVRLSREQRPAGERVGGAEETLYECRPAMFGNRPFLFLFALLLTPLGVGLVILLVWWLKTLGTKLTVTSKRTILEKGVFAKFSSEVRHADVRSIQIRQSFLHRLTNVGWLDVSTAAEEGSDISVSGIPRPARIKAMINGNR